MSPSVLRRYRAERLLRGEFVALRSKVLTIVRSRLQSKGLTLDPLDLEACYSQAWHGLYSAMLAGDSIDNPSGWLMLVTFRRAVDESRSRARQQVPVGFEAPDGYQQILDRERPIASDRDLASELDDRTRLRQVFEGFSSHLSSREREAASLCYLHGLSRAEAARQMGISEMRMRKLMDGASTGRPGVSSKVSRLLETIESGRWCEQQSSLIRAYALGVLDPDGERYELAVAHCRECPACRAHVASLRGLAVVLPLPLLAHAALLSPGALLGGKGVGTGPVGVGAAVGSSGTVSAGAGIAAPLVVKLAAVAVLGLAGGYVALGRPSHPHKVVVEHRRSSLASASPTVSASKAVLSEVARSQKRRATGAGHGSRSNVRLPFKGRSGGASSGPENASGADSSGGDSNKVNASGVNASGGDSSGVNASGGDSSRASSSEFGPERVSPEADATPSAHATGAASQASPTHESPAKQAAHEFGL
jgi:RNA polymerase sigma factor (sigma-70 family)